jgi:hypothetical protein
MQSFLISFHDWDGLLRETPVIPRQSRNDCLAVGPRAWNIGLEQRPLAGALSAGDPCWVCSFPLFPTSFGIRFYKSLFFFFPFFCHVPGDALDLCFRGFICQGTWSAERRWARSARPLQHSPPAPVPVTYGIIAVGLWPQTAVLHIRPDWLNLA